MVEVGLRPVASAHGHGHTLAGQRHFGFGCGHARVALGLRRGFIGVVGLGCRGRWLCVVTAGCSQQPEREKDGD